MRERYLDAVTKGHRLSRPIKVVVACGNGTACIVAPEALRRIGAEVIPMDAELDHSFPKYNPNPEDSHMLRAMSDAVREEGAEICLGFDGDDDRCDVVDDLGHEIFADKIGMLLARDLSARHANARFVVGIKSTALFETDPILKRNGGNHRVSPRSGLRQCRFPVQSRVRFRPGDALAPPLRLGVHRRPSGVGTARPGASL
jgi:phosphomannomutase/phosphoglucomutase